MKNGIKKVSSIIQKGLLISLKRIILTMMTTLIITARKDISGRDKNLTKKVIINI
jgi:hypothetical protein